MILSLGVMLAYIPGYIGSVIPTGWLVMFIALPAILFYKFAWCGERPELSPVHLWGIMFLLYAGISMLWSPHGQFAFMQLCTLAGVFIWAQGLSDLRKVSISLSTGIGISGIISLFQWAGYNPVFVVTPFPAGLFVNSNVFAEVTSLILVLLLVQRLWWWIPMTIPGLIVSSRATIIALLCVFLVWLWSRSRIAASALAGSLGAITVYALVSFRSDTISIRMGIWRDTWNGVKVFGNGIGSFEYLFPYYANHMDTLGARPNFAHNDILQLLFEVGIGIVPLLIALWYIVRVRDNHRYVLLCFGIIGVFGFPLHIPAEAFIAFCCLGHLANRQRVVWNQGIDSRPTILERMAVT